jgi:exodeoxyribonuclease VII small subunit
MSSPNPPIPSFEEAMERLDEIVESMEGERLDLNEMVGRYEEGVKLLAQCRQQIETARMRVERINALLDGSNKATLSDFDVPVEGSEEAESEAGTQKASGKGAVRRGSRPSGAPEGDTDIRLF